MGLSHLIIEGSRTFSKAVVEGPNGLSSVRHMGGGPRTFPGGLNKWQWKRLHEKKAKEKEKKLLHHERQLYQARIRSEIRSKLSPSASASASVSNNNNNNTHSPFSPKDHIKALADRFLLEGAEDLWNPDDGPISPPPPPPHWPRTHPTPPPDLRNLVSHSVNSVDSNPKAFDRRQNSGFRSRGFSTFAPSGMGRISIQSGGADVLDSKSVEFALTKAFNWRENFGFRSQGFSMFAPCGIGKVCDERNWVWSMRCSGLNMFVESGAPDESNAESVEFAAAKIGVGKVFNESDQIGFPWRSFTTFAPSGMGRMSVESGGSDVSEFESFEFAVRGAGRMYGDRYGIGLSGGRQNFSMVGRRHYSVEGGRQSGSRKRSSMNRWNLSSDDDDDGVDEEEVVRVYKKRMSTAALMNYDRKNERRRPKLVGDENGSYEPPDDIRMIRDELKRRFSDANAEKNPEPENKGESLLSQKRFDECNISPLTVKALTLAGYVQMTLVQLATLSPCLEGKDVLVKAKTGTGKSAAFLLPAIESVLRATSSNVNQRVPPILALILCPTRELACQIAAEANVMLKYHVGIGVQTLIGGTRLKVDMKHLELDPCQIIVATPGRLLDHIENKSGFSKRLMGLKVLILDEADHLLDLGFRKDIEKIVDCVPRARQSMLFSATIPKEVRRVSQLVLKRDHIFIDTVGASGVETPSKVHQSYLVAPHVQHFQIVYQLLKDHITRTVDYKVIVFCTTAMTTSLMFLLLQELKMNVCEIHSRKPQSYRTRISDEFRESKRLILITSDVSARGMDYPDVTLVIQMGIPSDREQYIQRLGRTGREGKYGEGMLVLAPWEEYFLDEIKDLPVERSLFIKLDQDVTVKMEDSMARVDPSVKEAAYHAWLGYYNSIREIGRDKTMLVELAKQFSESIGLQKTPALFRKTVNKMGLRDIPGIRIRK